MTNEQQAALKRLFWAASGDTGQSRRCADFLLAWHSAEENGGWDPTELWFVDTEIALDMLAVIDLISTRLGKYPADFGHQGEIASLWERRRKG